MNASQQIADDLIRHGVYLERYTKGQLAEILGILEKANSDILAKLAATVDASAQAAQGALLDEVRAVYKAAVAEMQARMTTEGKALADHEAAVAASAIEGVGIKTAMVTPEMLWSMIQEMPATKGAVLSELYSAYEAGTAQKIVQAIRQGFVEGEGVGDMVRRIRGSRASGYTDGVMQATRRGAESLVRTTVNHIANQAHEAVYQANADLISGEAWLATLDPDTCEECGALDGQEWPLDEGHDTPPAHVNCRCTIVPVLKSWEDMGLDGLSDEAKTALDGEPPERTTYADWLGRQDAAVQDDILGPNRGDLLRSGMPLDDMVKDSGGLYTLDELRAMTPGASGQGAAA